MSETRNGSRPAVQQFAGHYITLGFAPVPVLPHSKSPRHDKWPERTFTPDDFGPDDNIGLKARDGYVILDDDFPTPAVECADFFLPETGAVWGRASKPRSKRLYHVPDLKETLTLLDLHGNHAVQLRVADRNQQDVVPPSNHKETGERLTWAGLLTDPSSPELRRLLCGTRFYWSSRLIASVWPDGRRHDLRLAMARVLLDLGLKDAFGFATPESSDTATQALHFTTSILEWACRLGGSDGDGVRDVEECVRSTYARMRSGQRTSGRPTVVRLLGETGQLLLRRLRDGFGKRSPIEDAVDEFNRRYFIVDVGQDTVVGEEVSKTNSEQTRSWSEFRFRSFEDFRRKTIKHRLRVGAKKDKTPVYRSAADIWLEHPEGFQYERLVYAPAGSHETVGPNDLNGWRGFTVAPAPGNWSRTKTFLRDVVCRSDEDLTDFVLDWMAAAFQRPGQHAETALVCVGEQGTGKNIFAELVLGSTFDGRHATTTTHTRQVLGEFNDVLSGRCLLVLDEVGLKTETEYNAAKGLVTGHVLQINRKGIRVEAEPSMLHLIFLSNSMTPLKVAPDDRRFVFLHFASTHAQDTDYFARIEAELDREGGRAAMLAELLARRVNWDRLRSAPSTRSKDDAKRDGWTDVQWFVYRYMRGLGADWDNAKLQIGVTVHRAKKSELAAQYETYLEEDRRKTTPDATAELNTYFRRLSEGMDWDYRRPVDRGREYWTLPRWDVFVEWFEKDVGMRVDELHDVGMDDEADWLIDPRREPPVM